MASVVVIIRCQLKDVTCAACIILAIKKQGASTLCYYVHIYSMSEEVIMIIIEESSFVCKVSLQEWWLWGNCTEEISDIKGYKKRLWSDDSIGSEDHD